YRHESGKTGRANQTAAPEQRRTPMTPLFTVNLLRVLFVTFCAAIGAIASTELQGSMWPGVVLGLLLGLVVVLIDRLLKGFSLRAFSSATFGLLLGWIFAKFVSASQI